MLSSYGAVSESPASRNQGSHALRKYCAVGIVGLAMLCVFHLQPKASENYEDEERLPQDEKMAEQMSFTMEQKSSVLGNGFIRLGNGMMGPDISWWSVNDPDDIEHYGHADTMKWWTSIARTGSLQQPWYRVNESVVQSTARYRATDCTSDNETSPAFRPLPPSPGSTCSISSCCSKYSGHYHTDNFFNAAAFQCTWNEQQGATGGSCCTIKDRQFAQWSITPTNLVECETQLKGFPHQYMTKTLQENKDLDTLLTIEGVAEHESYEKKCCTLTNGPWEKLSKGGTKIQLNIRYKVSESKGEKEMLVNDLGSTKLDSIEWKEYNASSGMHTQVLIRQSVSAASVQGGGDLSALNYLKRNYTLRDTLLYRVSNYAPGKVNSKRLKWWKVWTTTPWARQYTTMPHQK